MSSVSVNLTFIYGQRRSLQTATYICLWLETLVGRYSVIRSKVVCGCCYILVCGPLSISGPHCWSCISSDYKIKNNCVDFPDLVSSGRLRQTQTLEYDLYCCNFLWDVWIWVWYRLWSSCPSFQTMKISRQAVRKHLHNLIIYAASPSGRAVYGVGLLPLACWDRGFLSNRGMDVCCECCVLSGRGLCDELITRPEESYRLWCVVVCDLENLKNRCFIYIYIWH